VAWNQGWANALAALIVEAKIAVDEATGRYAMTLEPTTPHLIRVRWGTLIIRVRWGTLIAKGFATNPAPVDKQHKYTKKAYNLLVRLDTQRADVRPRAAVLFCFASTS
jgi:hypothetical protein